MPFILVVKERKLKKRKWTQIRGRKKEKERRSREETRKNRKSEKKLKTRVLMGE